MLSKQFCSACLGRKPKAEAVTSFLSLFVFVPFLFLLPLSLFLPWLSPRPAMARSASETAIYVGSAACKGCHSDEYNSFVTYAKKSRSFESIEKLRHGLTPEEIERCYSCHTTGYGKQGGFVSLAQTPHLKNAGCEVCHGPGSIHTQTSNPDDIKRGVTTQDCVQCHISERVRAFRYKPMIHGGAH